MSAAMDCTRLQELLTAYVDRDFSDLTQQQIDDLIAEIDLCPECLMELRLELATKLCIEKHAGSQHCPQTTYSDIQSFIYHLLQLELQRPMQRPS